MVTQKLHIGSHTVRFELGADSVTFYAEGANGDGRFLVMKDGGGHLEQEAPGNITTGTGLELDSNGRAIFHET